MDAFTKGLTKITDKVLGKILVGSKSLVYLRGYPKGLVAYIKGLNSLVGPELLFSSVDESAPLKYNDGSLYIGPAFTNKGPADVTTSSGNATLEDMGDGVWKISITNPDHYRNFISPWTPAGQSRRIMARTVSGTGSVGLLTYSGGTDAILAELTEEWQEITYSAPVIDGSAGAGLYYFADFRTAGTTLTEFLFKEWQAVDQVGQFPYILPGTTQVDTSATSGGNGYSLEMSGEVPSGIDITLTPPETVSNGVYSDQSEGVSRLTALAAVGNKYPQCYTRYILEVGASYTIRGFLRSDGTNIPKVNGSGMPNAVGTLSTEWQYFIYTWEATSTTGPVFNLFIVDPDGSEYMEFKDVSLQKLIPYENEALKSCYRGAKSGVELLSNGDWSNGSTGWNLPIGCVPTGTTGITLTAVTNGENIRALPEPAPEGALVAITFVLSNWSEGSVAPLFGGLVGTAESSDGTYTQYGVIGSSIAYTGLKVINKTSGTIEILSIQETEPQPMTTAVLVKMGVGSDTPVGDINILALADIAGLKCIKMVGNLEDQLVRANDGTTSVTTGFGSTWDAGEYHLKIVQVSEDGLTFRAGNKRYTSTGVAIDADIVYSSWVAYDGSFDPLDYIRFGYGIAVPIGLKEFQQWNRVATDDEIIELAEGSL